MQVRKSVNKWTSLLLVVLMAVSILPLGTVSVSAAENWTWDMNTETGELTISGTGAMTDFENGWLESTYDPMPWWWFKERIKTVTVKEGITHIGSQAFDECANLTSITLPDSVTSIGSDAFRSCFKLTEITFPDNLQYVSSLIETAWYRNLPDGVIYAGKIAYKIKGDCPSSVTLKDGTVSIASFAFSGCTELENITIPDSVISIGSGAFKDTAWYDNQPDGVVYAGKIAYELKGDCPADISINNGTVFISSSLFYNRKELKSITLPNSVTSIGHSAFYYCTGLTSITIPNSVTSVGEHAFYRCTGLKSITFGDNLASIGARAFCGCTGLTNIALPNSVTSIGDSAFYNCTGLTSVTIPNSVKSIGDSAFYDCTGLTSVTIPNSVTSIGDSAFYNCTGLTSVTIPNSVTSIGRFAFYNCTGLTSVTVPNSVTSIGNDAFTNTAWYQNQPDGVVYAGKVAYDLKGDCPANVFIKSGTLSLASSLFYNCTQLKSIIIPNSVTSINYRTFGGCTGLTSITVPNSVTSIGSFAFYGCTGLTSITVPNSVTSIGRSAFYGCTGLRCITLGKKVAFIDSGAFGNCSQLKSVTVDPDNTAFRIAGNCLIAIKSKNLVAGFDQFVIPNDGSVTSIGDYAFYKHTGLTSVTVPNSVTSVGKYAFYGCTGLKSITFGDNLASIGDYAFYGCTNLKEITFSDKIALIGYAAFSACTGLTDVHFIGTRQQWEQVTVFCIDVEDKIEHTRQNTPLTEANVHYHTPYSITYKLNGGTNHADNPKRYADITPTFTFKNPTRKGYSFKGWYMDSTYETKISKIEKGTIGDVTLYAKWSKNTYAVNYKLNGGTNHKSNPKTYTVTAATVTLKNPTRKGYTFKGWYSDSKFKNKVTKIAKGSTGNKTLYAKWAKNTYKITYKLNKGSNSKKNPKTYTVTTATVTLKNPTRKGYTFKGWYSDSKFKNKVTKIAKGSTGNKTLYAKWAKTYTVTYKLNGGKNSGKNPKTYTKLDATVTLKNPTRKGYTFKGWYSDSKFKNKVTKIAKGSTGNKTLYAKWKKK